MEHTLRQVQEDINFQLTRDCGEVTPSLKNLVILGLVEEAGEVAALRKRELRHNFRDTKVLANIRNEYIEELGDVLWYLAACCAACGVSLEEVYQANVAKLEERYGGSND